MNALLETIVKKYTIEEYLRMEEQSTVKHHFVQGEIIPIPGATPTHNLIAVNILTELNIELRIRDKEYFVLNSDSQIYIPKLKNFVYPDAVVICEQVELYPGSTTVIMNPLLIVEVLSPSTARYDRTDKFFDYKRIPTFKEYVLVEQNLPLIMASFKTNTNTWEDSEADGLHSSIYLKSIDCTLELKRIYRGVKL